MLAIYFLISFPLIVIFFFLDQSNIPIIFINKEMKLQYLNIKLHDFDTKYNIMKVQGFYFQVIKIIKG